MCVIDSDLYFLIEKFPMIWSHFAPPGSENELGDLPAGLSLSLSPQSLPGFWSTSPLFRRFPAWPSLSSFTWGMRLKATWPQRPQLIPKGTFCKWDRGHTIIYRCWCPSRSQGALLHRDWDSSTEQSPSPKCFLFFVEEIPHWRQHIDFVAAQMWPQDNKTTEGKRETHRGREWLC